MVSERFLLQHRTEPWAREQLVERYRDFARFKAAQFFLAGGDHNDTLQEALLGLLNAITGYRSDAGSSFRSFADLCITRRLITAVKLANAGQHQPLNRSLDLAAPAGNDEAFTLGEVIPSRTPDAHEIVAQREHLRFVVEVVNGCSDRERDAFAHIVTGEPYAQRPDFKSVDNALQRVRRKIADRLAA